MLVSIIKRVLSLVLIAWAVATFVFVLVQLLPGRPFAQLAGPGVSEASLDHLRVMLGTEQPFFQRYAEWLTRSIGGDLGLSLSHRRHVAELVLESIGSTIMLTSLALTVQFALGIALGCLSAWSGSRWLRGTLNHAYALLHSMPSFWLALLLVGLFSLTLGWLPVSQAVSIDHERLGFLARLGDRLRHLLLPVMALALPSAAGVALYVSDLLRSRCADGADIAGTGFGLAQRTVRWKYRFPRVVPALIQLFGLGLPGLVGGSLVIETIFAWPGLGRLSYEAVLARDEPLIVGCALTICLAVLIGNALADALLAAFDPRTRV